MLRRLSINSGRCVKDTEPKERNPGQEALGVISGLSLGEVAYQNCAVTCCSVIEDLDAVSPRLKIWVAKALRSLGRTNLRTKFIK